ncbi:homoserine O-acetyltransferase/O-succinyltransferase family protein [Enterobacter hormaechei]
MGLVDFCDVAYWPQIERVIDWAKNHVTSTLSI